MTESKNFYSEAEMQEVLAELEKSIADREMLQAEKEQQQLIDEIDNLGAVKIRLRSLKAAIEDREGGYAK